MPRPSSSVIQITTAARETATVSRATRPSGLTSGPRCCANDREGTLVDRYRRHEWPAEEALMGQSLAEASARRAEDGLGPMPDDLRDDLSRIPRGDSNEAAAMLKAIHAAEVGQEALVTGNRVTDNVLEMHLLQAPERVSDRIKVTEANYSFPETLYRRIRSINLRQRIPSETRPRIFGRAIGADELRIPASKHRDHHEGRISTPQHGGVEIAQNSIEVSDLNQNERPARRYLRENSGAVEWYCSLSHRLNMVNLRSTRLLPGANNEHSGNLPQVRPRLF